MDRLDRAVDEAIAATRAATFPALGLDLDVDCQGATPK